MRSGILVAALQILSGAAMLLAAGLVSGHFGLFWDSAAYLRHGEYLATRLHLAAPIAQLPGGAGNVIQSWQSNLVLLSSADARSPFYGLFLFLGSKIGTFALVAAIQALIAAWLIRIATRIAVPGAQARAFVITFAVLALGSSLPFFIDFAMPDIFGGLAILGAALLLAARDRLSRLEACGIAITMVLAFAFHRTNTLVVPALTIAAFVIGAMLRQPLRPMIPSALFIAAAIIVSVGAGVAYKAFFFNDTGFRTGNPPFLMARILADGPGRTYLAKACPGGASPTLCAMNNEDYDDSNDFLWDPDPTDGAYGAAPIETRLQLQHDETRFVLASILSEPLMTAGAWLRNWAQQLVAIFVEEPVKNPGIYRFGPHADLPAVALMAPWTGVCDPETACNDPPLLQSILAVVEGAVVLLAIAAVIGIAIALRDARRIATIRRTGGLVLLGIVINAAVCGILSGPYARYQARVIWLLPMVAVLAALVWLQTRREKNETVWGGTRERAPRS